jgi:hypothetical protein
VDDPYKTIATLILGACLGGFITHSLAKGRERRRDLEKRKRDFRAAIASLRGNVLDAKDSELIKAYEQSLPRFRDECAKIEPDISDVGDFGATRDAYLSLTGPDIECRDANQKRPPNKDQFGNYVARPGWQAPCRYELGRQRIKGLLDTMVDYAR